VSGAPKEPGRIITFYSYKGGTGRSMALANVAWIIASNGYRVLVVDWDLEAPGLHRYLAPFLLDPDLVESDGVIDIVSNYVTALMTPPVPPASESDTAPAAASPTAGAAPQSASSGGDGAAQDLHEPYANVLRYATSLTWRFPVHEGRQGWIDFVPAGRQGASYGSRMNAFSWVNFYDRLGGGGFIEALKQRMKEEYDYVLIDSRTGVSDTSGVCTVQLPDVLAVCFTLNRQSVEGAGAVAASVQAARQNASGAAPLRVFPIPTRVEKAEKEKLDLAHEAAADQFAPVLAHVDESKWKQYWGDVEVLYEPFYAYEEVLATFRDPIGHPASMLASMERVASWLTDGRVTSLVPAEEGERQRALARYARQARKTRPRGALSSSEAELQFYISYARSDLDESLERFFGDLEREVRTFTGSSASSRSGFVDLDIAAGTDWQQQLEGAIQRSRVLVPMYSPAYFSSENTGKEFQHFLARAASQKIGILPVIWVQPAGPLPSPVKAITYTSPTFPEEYRNLGLRSLMRLRRYDDTYHKFLMAYAQRLVEVAREIRIPTGMATLAATPSAFAAAGTPPPQQEPAPESSRRLDSPESMDAFIQSIPTMDRQSLEEACEHDVIPYISVPHAELTPRLISRLIGSLNERHLYSAVERAIDALPESFRSPWLDRFRAEALIFQNESGAALPILKALQLNPALTDPEKVAVLGLVGEACKRLYIESGTPLLPVSRQNAIRAIRAYKDAHALSPLELWHGINIAALFRRLSDDGVSVPGELFGGLPRDSAGALPTTLPEAASGVAREILDKVQERVGHGDATFWDFAVAAQASVEIDQPEDLAVWIASCVGVTDDAFDLSVLLYQLTEVWRLDSASDAGRYALPLLCAAVLKGDEGALSLSIAQAETHIKSLSNIDDGFFKRVGAESMKHLDWYQTALERAQYVVEIELHDGRRRGLGVLVTGKELWPNWEDTLYLITSTSLLAPVVDGAGIVSLPPARLSLGIGHKSSNIGPVVFSSQPADLDVTVTRLQFPYFPGGSRPVAARRPPSSDPRTRAYTIDFASDRPMLSMSSRQVLDRDATRLHVSTSDAAASVGSPLFNRDWELLGIQRAQDDRVRRLNGKEGTYRAAEVTWIGAIKEALASLPG